MKYSVLSIVPLGLSSSALGWVAGYFSRPFSLTTTNAKESFELAVRNARQAIGCSCRDAGLTCKKYNASLLDWNDGVARKAQEIYQKELQSDSVKSRSQAKRIAACFAIANVSFFLASYLAKQAGEYWNLEESKQRHLSQIAGVTSVGISTYLLTKSIPLSFLNLLNCQIWSRNNPPLK